MNAQAQVIRRRVARLDELPVGDVIGVQVDDREIAVYRLDSGVYATANICTHGAARLCDGFVDGYSIECPLHQGAFDVRTGAVIRAPAEEPIATYAVEIENGDVYVVLPGTAP